MEFPHVPNMPSEVVASEERPRGVVTFLHGVLLVVVGLLVLATLVTAINSFRAKRALARATEQRRALQSAIATLEQAVPSSLILAKETIDRLNASRLLWSQVVTTMLETAPQDVLFRSYSGTPDGTVIASGLTTNVPAVANTIQAFFARPDFADVFVSNVARGVTDAGQPVVSFQLSFRSSAH